MKSDPASCRSSQAENKAENQLENVRFWGKQFFEIRQKNVQKTVAVESVGQVSREFFVRSRPRPANTKLWGKLTDRTPKSWAIQGKQHIPVTKGGTEEMPAVFVKCAEQHENKSELGGGTGGTLHEIKSELQRGPARK